MKRSVVLLAATLLAACGSAEKVGDVLNVGSQKGGTKSVMLAAHALDGAPYTVSWSEFPAAQTLLEAIGSNAVDIGLAGDAPFQFAYQSGSPIRAIGAQTMSSRPTEYLAIIVPKASTAHGLADLKGKTITTTRGSIGHYLVLRALDAAGIPATAVRFVFLAPGDAKAAFDSGSIDAWAIWMPYLTVALRQQARIITDASVFPRSYGFEVASDKAIATKRAMLADFLKREAAALEWAKTHKTEFATVLARETGLPRDIAQVTAYKAARSSVQIDDEVVAAQHDVAQQFAKAGALAPARPEEAAFDRSFSAKAN